MQVALPIVLMASALSPAAGKATATLTPSSPTAAVQCLASAYERRSIQDYGALLAADYRFHISPSQKVARYVDGDDRNAEIEAASQLFGGGGSQPAAAEIHTKVDGVTESRDPEHPDSSAYYRIVAVSRFSVSIRTESDMHIQIGPGLHVFHLVRGDAAVRVAGQPGGAGRWYVRRWLEDIDGVTAALGDTTGGCGEPAGKPVAAAAPGGARPPAVEGRVVPVALDIHPLGNPACPALEIQCDLPGSEPARVEVFDVQGRLVNHRDLPDTTPGTVQIEAGAGAAIAPGVYWVRLSQASRKPSTRMVVVAR